MDVNFKLKQKDRGFKDPPLFNGLAHMVSDTALKAHLVECASKNLISEVCGMMTNFTIVAPNRMINTCGSTFHAVNQTHTKFSQGYSVTGVGAVDCARHGFKRLNGVVDLQKGEW